MKALVAEDIREAVRHAYSKAAEAPQEEHPFPVGRAFAESVGYPGKLLDSLPSVAVEAFAGVSNVAIFAEITVDDHVLDLGCGAGLDSLIAADRVGPTGRVTGIEFSAAMMARARQAAEIHGVANIQLVKTAAENLPMPDDSVDVAMVNGIFNLNPARDAIFRELARVIRKGGSVYAAELILREPLPPETVKDPSNWFA